MAREREFILTKDLMEKKDFAGSFECELAIKDHEALLVVNHWHPSVEILYINKGSFKVILHNEELSFSEGELVVINPGEMHGVKFDGTMYLEFICIKYDPVILENPYYYSKELPIPDSYDDVSVTPPPSFLYEAGEIGRSQIPSLIHSIQKEAHNQETGFDMIVRSNLMGIYAWLLRRWNKENHLTISTWHYSAYKRLVAVFQYIQKNYVEDITTSDMAKILAVSVPHFCRSFKKIAGCSFRNYLQSFRVSEATKYLLSTDFNITQIASRVGYEDVNFFIRIFKKQTGMSPLRYRKKYEIENAPLVLLP